MSQNPLFAYSELTLKIKVQKTKYKPLRVESMKSASRKGVITTKNDDSLPY